MRSFVRNISSLSNSSDMCNWADGIVADSLCQGTSLSNRVYFRMVLALQQCSSRLVAAVVWVLEPLCSRHLRPARCWSASSAIG